MPPSPLGATATRSFALGWVSGGRTTFGPVALALTHRQTASRLRKLRSLAVVMSAAGELIVDKLPQTPSRLEPHVLAGRVATGALAAAGLARRNSEPVWLPLVWGSAGALAGSTAGVSWRRWAVKHAPDWQAAVAEDLLTGFIAWRVIRSLNAPDSGLA